MLTMSGRDLKLQRVAAGVKVYELAARMNVHSSRVSQIEALAVVTAETVARYRAALAACQVTTSAPATVAGAA
jgi:transcriptional regulator with XRE-family HTH domain